MTTFTDGNWEVDNSGYFNRVFSDGILISEIKFGANGDAHLIACAPDMYAMIKELADMMDKLNEGFNADCKATELSDKAESLLKKARGE